MARALLFLMLAGVFAPSAQAKPVAHAAVQPADYATEVAGAWHGSVISDARGGGHNDVTITITRIGPNKVQVACDYTRVPTVTMTLARYADSLQAASGPYVFLIDMKKNPNQLDLTIDDASLAVSR